MTWTKIDKETSNWSKTDKTYMGWLVNGWLVYGWLISTSNWTKVEKE